MKRILFLLVFLFIIKKALSQNCIAYFTYTVNMIDSMLFEVTFTNSSQVTNCYYYYYYWNFGDYDSLVTTQSIVTHYYYSPGFYDVCLTIYCNDSMNFIPCATYCQEIYINNGLNCNSSFFYTVNFSTVKFYNFSFANQFLWDFGDGTQSSEENPVHSYNATGTYNVCLIATDTYSSCTDTFCTEVTIDCNFYDNAYFWYYYGTIKEVYFYPYVYDSSGVKFTWNFGDGTFSNQAFPSHIYNDFGQYTVCLSLSDINGVCPNSLEYCQQIEVNCADVYFYYYKNNSEDDRSFVFEPYIYIPVVYYDSVIVQDSIINITWNFGDGTIINNEYNVVHTFNNYGQYLVCLSITTNNNCNVEYCDTIEVNCCNISFSYTIINNSVQFTPLVCNSTDSIGVQRCFYWWFSDSTYDFSCVDTYSPHGEITHTFPQTGVYNVCLYDDKCYDLYCTNIYVGSIGANCAELYVDASNFGVSQFWPGTLAINVCNFGDITANNVNVFMELNENLELINSNPPAIVNNNQLQWGLNSLPSGICKNIYVDLVADSTTSDGDVLCSSIYVNTSSVECGVLENFITECMNVAVSYDPNEKYIASSNFTQKGYVYTDTIYNENSVKYKITFQNTGSAPAYRVIIYDTLNVNIDPMSVIVGASSHPYTYFEVYNNILKWTFLNINLPPSSTSPEESIGFVSFSAKLVDGLIGGTLIPNNAAIIFDYNPPVITNSANLYIGQLSSSKNSISCNVYPNPFDNYLIINVDALYFKIEIFNLTGNVLYTNIVKSQTQNFHKLYLNNLPSGFYLLKVTDLQTGNVFHTKIIKK